MSEWCGVDHITRVPNVGGWTVLLLCGHFVNMRKLTTVIETLSSWTLECARCQDAKLEGNATAGVAR